MTEYLRLTSLRAKLYVLSLLFLVVLYLLYAVALMILLLLNLVYSFITIRTRHCRQKCPNSSVTQALDNSSA